ncbi:MAG: hypothetical protein HKN12_00780, partial [Gemmatimonadetes bacterium]|nr:hypothetical protein [Gemmatimonadota bacterium]
PALRERRDDIALLTRHFLRDCVGKLTDDPVEVSAEALGRLLTYGWPGNVRELQNVVGSCAFFAREAGVIDVAHLPESIATPLDLTGDSLTDEIAQLERGRILRALKKAKGVKTEAARELGISRKGLRDRMRRLGLSADSGAPRSP